MGTIGGLPALRYPDAPTPGLPVSATTRAAFVFLGEDEYELQCQWTVAERAAVLERLRPDAPNAADLSS